MRKLYNYHPLSTFVYFFCTICLTMFTFNPIVIGISLLGAVCLSFAYFSAKTVLKRLVTGLVTIAILTLINPLIVHRGVTELLFINGKPITLEALLYGLNTSVMLVAVVCWFAVYNEAMSSDKFIYLFKKTMPKIALMISSILAFIPKLKRQYQDIEAGQIALGYENGDGFVDKIKSGIRRTQILFTSAIENSVETGQSMEARGYGQKRKSGFGFFRFKLGDGTFLAWTLIVFTAIITLLGLGIGRFSFYPTLTTLTASAKDIALYVLCFLGLFTGIIMEIKEEILWQTYLSKN